jgi:hypothetical protein
MITLYLWVSTLTFIFLFFIWITNDVFNYVLKILFFCCMVMGIGELLVHYGYMIKM